MSERKKWNFGDWINERLQESPHEQFRKNKWKFWFITVAGFALINAGLTAAVFNTGGQLQQYLGAVLLGVGALVAWLCVAGLHYSDGPDRGLARSVALLDSGALVFVVIHFGFLVWIYGHLITLQNAEAKYETAAATYNAKAEKVSTDNVEIAKAAQTIAQENTKQRRLESDAAFQLRKAAEAGRGILIPAGRRSGSTEASGSGGPGLSTSVVELERPTKPTESSAAFLTRWDALIRIANICELLLAIATLIVIRNRSAKTNTPAEKDATVASFLSTAYRSPVARPAFTKTATQSDTVSRQSVEHKETTQDDTAALREGLKVLRETLRDIAFYTPGVHYKCDLKPDCVWIRQMTSDSGIQRTGHGAKARHSILRAALKMEPERYRAEVEAWLSENGFEL